MYSILIVDDEPIIRTSIRVILERSNLPVKEIREAVDGCEAMESLGKHISHIVITDIRMPNMDGLMLCSKIAKKCPQIVMMILSGYDDFKYAQEAMKYGVKEYVLKPVSKSKLLLAVSNMIEKIELTNKIYNLQFNNQFDELIELLENGIWQNHEECLSQGFKKLFDTFLVLPLDYCIKAHSEIMDIMLRRLSLKVGYTIRIKVDEFQGIEKDSFFSWIENSINMIKNEIGDRRKIADYNLIELAKNYIQENYNKEISLEEISEKMGLSPNYFSLLFKTRTGKTFVQYRSETRIMKAKEMLCQADKSVTEVAFEVGFNDLSHFIKSFKKATGDTPTEFRQKRGIWR